MYAQVEKSKENKNRAVANCVNQNKRERQQGFGFVDNRPETIAQRKMQTLANSHSTRQQQPIQKKENNTGLPDNLKSGVESLSGMSLDGVNVHYNSSQPAQLNALAYAQGTDIHIALGQERHLPHEAWHVVQQKQGRVKPIMQMKAGVNINDDYVLENEADVMGTRAIQNNVSSQSLSDPNNKYTQANTQNTIQRKVIVDGKPAAMLNKNTAFVNRTDVDLGSKNSDWVVDGYTRNYVNTNEFRDHVQGSPVDVGLARKLGKWYRLPFFSKKQFFVLGENHGAFGYRELIRESNQPGNVLGEGGSNDLMSADQVSALELNPKGLKDQSKQPREHTMENTASKTYFGLTYLKKHYEKEAKGGSSGGSSKPDKLPETEWLENYQNAHPDRRGAGKGLNALPYYLNSSDEKIYATYGTKAENYNTTNTATKILDDFAVEINAYNGPVFDNLTNAKDALGRLLTIQNNDSYNFPRLIGALNNLLGCMLNLSFSEAQKLSGGDPKNDLKARYKEVKKNQKKWDPHMQKAMAHRDYVMYKSVLKARHDHIMAGMGDHHATNLKDDLGKVGIPVILFDDFLSNYSIDAISPLKEVAGYTEAVEQTEMDRDQYASIFMKIAKEMSTDQLSGTLVPFSKSSAPDAFQNIQFSGNILEMLHGISISEAFLDSGSIDQSLFADLMKSMQAEHPDFISVQNAPLAITNAVEGMNEQQGLPKVRQGTPEYIAQIRRALKGLYVYPISEAVTTHSALVTKTYKEDTGIAMTAVFDRFINLLNMAGDININFSGTLNQCLAKLITALEQGFSQDLISASDIAIRQQLILQLASIFTITGMGKMTLSSLLNYVDSTTDSDL